MLKSILSSVRRGSCVAALLAVCLVLAGCVDMDTEVVVNPDGSGTVTRTMAPGKTLAAMIEKGKKQNGKVMSAGFPPEMIAQTIAELGGKVRLVSNQRFGEGMRAVYAFDDINQLTVSITSLPKNAPANSMHTAYSFRMDSPDHLRVIASEDRLGEMTRPLTPQEQAQADALTKDSQFRELMEQTLKMTKAMLKDGRVSLRLRFERDFITSAMYRDGSSIDVEAYDFSTALNSPEFDKGFLAMQNASSERMTREELMALRIPGMRVEFQKEFDVYFR